MNIGKLWNRVVYVYTFIFFIHLYIYILIDWIPTVPVCIIIWALFTADVYLTKDLFKEEVFRISQESEIKKNLSTYWILLGTTTHLPLSAFLTNKPLSLTFLRHVGKRLFSTVGQGKLAKEKLLSEIENLFNKTAHNERTEPCDVSGKALEIKFSKCWMQGDVVFYNFLKWYEYSYAWNWLSVPLVSHG